MQEPNITFTAVPANVGIVALATIFLGPLLGEYAIVVGLGLLGTLIGLSENAQPSLWRSLVFLFRGVSFSCVFTGVVTALIVKFSPVDLGSYPYAVMGCVAFTIGWFSDRLGILKSAVINRVSSIISSLGPKQ